MEPNRNVDHLYLKKKIYFEMHSTRRDAQKDVPNKLQPLKFDSAIV